MSEGVSYRRLSHEAAAARAKELVERFLASQELKWDWQVIGQQPAEKATQRKAARHWRVGVNWSGHDGSTIDGASVIAIDLETGHAEFLDWDQSTTASLS